MTAPIPGSLPDIITWIRRIVKPNSDAELSDDTIVSYINRFYTVDMPQETQLFELTQRFSMDCIPNINYYTFPPRAADISGQPGPILQDYIMIQPPMYCDGVQIGYFQSDYQFYRAFPEQVFNSQVATGAGLNLIPNFTLSNFPIQRTYNTVNKTLQGQPQTYRPYVSPALIFSTVDASDNAMYVIDDGAGNLIQTDNTFINIIQSAAGSVDYLTGEITGLTFSPAVKDGAPVYCQSLPYQAARPIAVLFTDSYLKLYPVPDKAYKIDIDCMISPARFLSSDSVVPYTYMSEYIARGAARKILLDTGDMQQLNLYEPEFKRQQLLVLRRSSKQRQVDRVPTIFSTYIGYPLFYQLQ